MFSTLKCPQCGANIKKGNFCEYCGARLILNKPSTLDIQSEDFSSFVEGDFFMTVEDIFKIIGRGTIITGFPQSVIKVGDRLVNQNNNEIYTVRAIEMFRKTANQTELGNPCGVLISGDTKKVNKNDKLVKIQ